MLTLDEIETLFCQRGGEQYSGEPVTQLAHALQTATLAELDGADDALVTAALLHDLGHLVHALSTGPGDTPTLRGVDDLHQFQALPFLRGRFPDRVLDAIQRLLAEETGLPVLVAEDPLTCVVRGCGKIGRAHV